MFSNETTLTKRPNDKNITTIGYRTVLNNEQSPYNAQSAIKGPEMTM